MKRSPVRENVGFFGGSFDPIHWGHLVLAEHFLDVLGLDRVLFVPARQSPFKEERIPADAKDRVEMIRLSISGNPRFQLELRELRREGSSYTVDTLRELVAEHPDWCLHLLLGADAAIGFDRWKEPEAICQLARIHVARRGGHPPPDLSDLAPFLQQAGQSAEASVVDVPQIEISSTDIRRRLREGRSIRYLVHPAVEAYLESHSLYGARPPAPSSTID
ncbi:MAG: putative nicotinate-nucleotide adenylyltransferase [Pirellulaceae bacterium]|nr:MAG: putative nicotinate-nucleotide adenylyltransferase [Pirellulaceae bacterium]